MGKFPRFFVFAAAMCAWMAIASVAAPAELWADLANTFSTTTAVAPSGTLVTTVTTAGATITGSTPVAGCPLSGIGTSAVTYTCIGRFGGIAVGTPITQTFAGASGSIAETATYNANGPTPSFPAVTDPSAQDGSCTGPANSAGGDSNTGGTSTCTGLSPAAVGPGGTLRLNVVAGAFPNSSTRGAVTYLGPTSVGNCPRTDPAQSVTTQPSAGLFVSDVYTCGPGQSISTSATVSLTVTVQTAGTALLHLTANENAPLAAVQGIPSPVTQSITAGTPATSAAAQTASPTVSSTSPALTAITPTSGPVGAPVTLTGTGLTGVTGVLFGAATTANAVCSGGTTCFATVPALPTGVTVNVIVTASGGIAGPLSFTVAGPAGTATTASTSSTSTSGSETPSNATPNTSLANAGSPSNTSTSSSQPPSNVSFAGVPSTGAVGQTLTFNAAPAGSNSSCGTIQSYSFDFGDGSGTQSGQSVTHAYTAPGSYQLTLTVTDCAGAVGIATTAITISAPTTGSTGSANGSSAASNTGSTGSPTASPPNSPATGGTALTGSTAAAGSGSTSSAGSGSTAAYLMGWNLIAGPQGTVVNGISGAIYTFQAGDTDYEQFPSGTPLQTGKGYWAYFPSAAAGILPAAGAQTYSVFLPAGQYVMIGNPGSTPASVSGADTVVIYDPFSNGYVPVTTLTPGQGAWAFSANGGSVTIAGQ